MAKNKIGSKLALASKSGVGVEARVGVNVSVSFGVRIRGLGRWSCGWVRVYGGQRQCRGWDCHVGITNRLWNRVSLVCDL